MSSSSSSNWIVSSFRWHHLQIHLQNPTTRRIIIFTPPLIVATYYLCKRIYLYMKVKDRKKKKSYYFDACDSYELSNSTSINSINNNHTHNNDDSLDGKKIKPALSLTTKCSYCRSNQKLSFKDSNPLEQSLKNLSTSQMIKLSLDNLNNVNKALEEIKMKQNILKDFNLDTKNFDEKFEEIVKKLESLIQNFEYLRSEVMPLTYGSPIVAEAKMDFEDDLDDGASYLSSVTSLGYWDPEPNLHFFQLYQDALKMVDSIKPPKTDRTLITGSENYDDFLAKVHCLREAFAYLFTNEDMRCRFGKIGEEILRIMLGHSLRDSNECIKAYYTFLDFVQQEENYNTIETEIEPRRIAMVSFYDIVLDYMILESFDDLENPPSAVKSVISNQWLSASFREMALQTTVSTVMRRKRSKLIVKDGFFEHFYCILDHLSPILAWGFLGTDENLKFKCESVKDSTHAVIHDYFSFDRCRYTYIEDLCEDIKRVTEERFWELNNKLKIINS